MLPTTLIILILIVGAVVVVFARYRRQPPAVDQTFAGRFLPGRLPLDVDIIAGHGRNKPAPQTFQEFTLRPTLGLRSISIGLSCVMIWQLFGTENVDLIMTDAQHLTWLKSAIIGLLAYGMVFINTYELRYDNDRFLCRNWAFQKREFLWKDLLSIKDDAHYQYVLRTEQGKRVEIQKYLVGIDKFVAYAQEKVAENDRS